MAEFVNRCSVEMNGIVFEDFDNFTETSVSVAKPVPLMNKSGTAKMLPRYSFSVNVKKANIAPDIDPRTLFGATFTVEYDNGDRVSFGGVATNEVGDASTDGETETSFTITYSAETRTPGLELG